MSRKPRDDVPPEYVRNALSYDKETGLLFWKNRPDMGKAWNTKYEGRQAGTLSSGYISISINYTLYRAHRLAYVIVTGDWPEFEIDHRDGNRGNNRWSNLRPATRLQNGRNVENSGRNTSGFRGVSWAKTAKKWTSRIKHKGVYIHLGLFATPEEASRVYEETNAKYHNEFSYLNRRK